VRALLVVAALLLAACNATVPATPAPTTTSSTSEVTGPTPSPSLSAEEAWTEDLDRLDAVVRDVHVNPFAIHSEDEWSSRLAEVRAAIPTATTTNDQLVLLASLVGLLDTHSALVTVPGGSHFYGLLPYRFDDGWFVVRASDETLIGDRLLSIGGVPIDDVVNRLAPLVPHDNPTGLIQNLLWILNSVEYLVGAGIVADEERPQFEVERSDGTTVSADPPMLDEDSYRLVGTGWLQGDAPQAVARRGERIWTRLDEASRTLLISVNDYGDMTDAIKELTDGFDSGRIERVVFDMRYLQGGSGDIRILEPFIEDPRFDEPDVVTALIGRENYSVATEVAYLLDRDSGALLVGEPTPARANNFTCPCHDVTLPNSGFVVSVPQYQNHDDDPASAVEPDVLMGLSSVDFFAGRDPVLDAAMSGMPSGPPQ
jgi:hypothetical protein